MGLFCITTLFAKHIVIKRIFFLGFFLSWLILTTSCKKEIFQNSIDSISFSTDSLVFDTVFTSIGSISKRITIVNNSNSEIVLNSIYLGGKAATGNSPYRLNINGFPQNSISNFSIPAKDSIYVFAEVTINPGAANLPFLVTDSLVIEVDNKVKKVHLVAYGQNAYFHYGETIEQNTTWTNDKPHVIVNYVLIDTLKTLNVMPGAKLYFSPKSWLYVLGSLNLQGSKSDSIIIRGDRIDPYYNKLAGSWGGIHFLIGSTNNQVNWTDIRNGSIGLRIDSLPVSGNLPNVSVRNSRIHNMLYFGILAYTSRLEIENSLLTDCGRYVLACDLGADAKIRHTTFGSAAGNFVRSTALTVFTNSDYLGKPMHLKVDIQNCIIWGDRENEIELGRDGNGTFDFKIKNSLIKSTVTELISQQGNVSNKTPRFRSPENYSYRLDSLSNAAGIGNPALIQQYPSLTTDLDGVIRKPNPAAGCFEYLK